MLRKVNHQSWSATPTTSCSRHFEFWILIRPERRNDGVVPKSLPLPVLKNSRSWISVVAYFPPLFYWGESHEPAEIPWEFWWQILLNTSIHLTSQFCNFKVAKMQLVTWCVSSPDFLMWAVCSPQNALALGIFFHTYFLLSKQQNIHITSTSTTHGLE